MNDAIAGAVAARMPIQPEATDLMSSSDATSGVGSGMASTPTVAPAVTPEIATQGQRFANAVVSQVSEASRSWQAVAEAAGAGLQGSVADLLKFQVHAMQAMVQVDYTGKMITKTGQVIDQLVKTQ